MAHSVGQVAHVLWGFSSCKMTLNDTKIKETTTMVFQLGGHPEHRKNKHEILIHSCHFKWQHLQLATKHLILLLITVVSLSRSYWQVNGNNADTNATVVCTHRRSESPSVDVWVVAFHCVQVWWTIIAADCVQLTTTRCQRHAASFHVHRCNSSPQVGRRVIALDWAQEHVSIVATCYVHFAVQRSHAKSTSLWQHRRSGRPRASDTVIYLHLAWHHKIHAQRSKHRHRTTQPDVWPNN